jgi:hypothetical protein
MELFFLIVVCFVILFFVVSRKSYTIKDNTITKEEIINQYENDLKKNLEKYHDNKSKQLEQKKIFIQNCNAELARNIFFTEKESIQVIQRLSKL